MSKRKAAVDSLTDEQLIRAFVNEGETGHFGILFERYTHLVFGVCMKYLHDAGEAEDAVMAIFEKLMADLKKHEVHDFRNWLYRVAKNHCLMVLRKQKTAQKAENEILREKQGEFMEILSSGHLPLENEEEGFQVLYDALASLRKEQRKCLELMYFEKKSYHEIATITGYDLKQVKSHIQNGKRNLKIKITAG